MHLDKLPRKSVALVSRSHQTGLAGVALSSLHSSGDLPQILMPVWRTSYYLEPSPLPFTSYLFYLNRETVSMLFYPTMPNTQPLISQCFPLCLCICYFPSYNIIYIVINFLFVSLTGMLTA